MSITPSPLKYCYPYPRPAVTADCVLFSRWKDHWQVLLIERGHEPYQGCWAFPGGFLDEDETIEECAARELFEETGIAGIELKQFHTFSSPGRDPRGRTISVVFTGFADPALLQPVAGDDAIQLGWFPVSELPVLAFDHLKIIEKILQVLDFPK